MADYDPDNIFAKMIKGDVPCYKLFEDDDTLAFLDISPRTEGHTLVITKEPAADLSGVSQEGLGKLMGTVQRLAPKIKEAVAADGVLIQQFNGEAAGQSVFHLHVHIVPMSEGMRPRRHGDEDAAEPEALAALAEKIRAALE